MYNRYTRVFSASSESFDPQTWPDNLAWGGTSRYTITMSRLVIPHCRRSAWNSGLALTAASLSAISSATMLDRTPGMACHELIVPWLRDNGFVDSSCVAIQQYRKCLSLNWVAWGWSWEPRLWAVHSGRLWENETGNPSGDCSNSRHYCLNFFDAKGFEGMESQLSRIALDFGRIQHSNA